MPLNYGGYNQNTGGFMSPQQAGMNQNDFRFFMNQANQMGAMQPQYGPRQPDMQNLRGGPYRPGQTPGLRPITPPIFNGGVGGMRGGAASQGGITMPAQGMRVGYAPPVAPVAASQFANSHPAQSVREIMQNTGAIPTAPPSIFPKVMGMSMPHTRFGSPDVRMVGENESILPSEYGPQSPPPLGRRQHSPQEAAQLADMNRQHENMKLRDQNLPQWQDNVAELNRQAQVMENTQLPATPTGITPQQAFMQIPGNYLTGYQNRFNAIEANRPVAPPQVTASSASPEFKNYAQAIAQADPSFNPNAPAYSVDANGAITPRKPITPPVSVKVAEDGKITYGLTPEDAARMNAVGSSIGEWKKKADWLAKNGGGVMTPELAQKYADQQKIARDKLTANSDGLMQKWRDQKDAFQNRRVAIAQRNFMIRNPGLFTPINPNAAQMVSSMAQGSLQRFTPSGLTPAEDARLKSDQSNQYMDQARYWASVGNSAMAEEAMRRSQEVWQNTNTINGSVPNQPPVNPRNVFSASQSFRDEQGDFNNTKFGDALAAHDAAGMTKEGLTAAGITESFLQDYIRQNSGVFSGPTSMANVNRARKALGVLSGSASPDKPPSATVNANIPATTPPNQQQNKYNDFNPMTW